MERSDYKGAIQSFGQGRAQMQHYGDRPLFVISLVSFPIGVFQETAHFLRQITGWKFDDLSITIRQRICEALYSAGLRKDAGNSLLELIKTFEKDVSVSGAVTKWVFGELTFCDLCTVHSTLFVRFHAKMPFRSRK